MLVSVEVVSPEARREVSVKELIGVMCMRYLVSDFVDMAIHFPSGEIANLTVLPSRAQGISYDRSANPAPWSLCNR